MYRAQPSLIAALLVTSFVGLGGCQNACDAAGAAYADKLEECGMSDMAGDQSGECTDADAAYDECIADCAVAASCETLRGEDSDGVMALAECNNTCDS